MAESEEELKSLLIKVKEERPPPGPHSPGEGLLGEDSGSGLDQDSGSGLDTVQRWSPAGSL